MPHQITVAAAIIFREDSRFLIARKRSGLPNEGLWEFPGGKSEHEELPLKTVEREIMEELSMSVHFHKECYCSYLFEQKDEGKIIQFHFFIAWSKDPSYLLKDHDNIVWINPDESKCYDLMQGDRLVMEFLIKDYERACSLAEELSKRP